MTHERPREDRGAVWERRPVPEGANWNCDICGQPLASFDYLAVSHHHRIHTLEPYPECLEMIGLALRHIGQRLDILERRSRDRRAYFMAVEELRRRHPGTFRLGQAFVVTLFDFRPELANTLRNLPDISPFAEDEKLPAFLTWLEERWELDGQRRVESEFQLAARRLSEVTDARKQ